MIRNTLMRCALGAAAFAGCGSSTKAPTAPAAPAEPAWDREKSLREAAAYLLRHLEESGRFDYVRQSTVSDRKYNILRHAGSIHALVQYYEEFPNQELADAIVRSARYLKERYVRTLPKHPELAAAVSRPGEENLKVETAKLGGTALAVVAFCGARSIDESVVSKDELAAMGRFLLFMQRDDGSFYSKYLVGDTYDETFHSLYYPGETMLALTKLYDVDGNAEWLLAAQKSAAQLIQSRKGRRGWPADHWMMLASVPLLERWSAVESPPLTPEELAEHVDTMGGMIMDDQKQGGHFAGEPRSTPTATRLEGLSALAHNQDQRGGVAPRLERSIGDGLRFLLDCQLRSDDASRGGIPRSCAASAATERRGREIRIDYVQHFMSAVLTAPESAHAIADGR